MANEIEKKKNFLEKTVDWMIENDRQKIDAYVNKLRSQNPGISNDDLAKKIVRRKSIKNGFVGGFTGLGGLITLPVAIPTDLALSWKIQILMAITIARVYGRDNGTSDMKTDIYLILAGDSAKEALKKLGIETSKGVTKKAINKYLTREVMCKIWKIVPRKIITRAGEKSFTSFMKMVPFVGFPVGYAFDWAAAKAAGGLAIRYYSGRG